MHNNDGYSLNFGVLMVLDVHVETLMSQSTSQQSQSADRVNVFISTPASRIQAPIYCFGGNAF